MRRSIGGAQMIPEHPGYDPEREDYNFKQDTFATRRQAEKYIAWLESEFEASPQYEIKEYGTLSFGGAVPTVGSGLSTSRRAIRNLSAVTAAFRSICATV
jgi:hypothetical protein